MRYGDTEHFWFSLYFVDICSQQKASFACCWRPQKKKIVGHVISWAGSDTCRWVWVRRNIRTHGRDTALPLVHCCSHLSCGGDDGGVAVLVCSSSVTGIVLIHGRGGVLLLLLSTAATGGSPDTEAAAAAAAVRRLRPRRPESPARRTLQRLAQHATRGTEQQPPFLLCCLCLVSRSAQHQ